MRDANEIRADVARLDELEAERADLPTYKLDDREALALAVRLVVELLVDIRDGREG